MANQSTTPIAALSAVLLLAGTSALRGQGCETGDVDGDGRLSIADLVLMEESFPIVPGCLEALADFPCREYERAMDSYAGAEVFLEILRRGVPGALPHWDNLWGDAPPAGSARPLTPDPRATVEFLPMAAAGGPSDRVKVRLKLTTGEPLRAFALVLESEGSILRPTLGVDENASHFWWSEFVWRVSWRVIGTSDHLHRFGETWVTVTPQTYLITGGKYVITFNLRGERDTLIPAGEHLLETQARLPRRTAPGKHAVRLLPASEVLLEGLGDVPAGILVGPQPLNEGTIDLERTVEDGWDEGLPPLQLDPVSRTVLGKVELRFSDEWGRPAPEGEPLLTLVPGEEARLRLQLRTEIPLNHLQYRVRWAWDRFSCLQELVFMNPEDGKPYLPVGHGDRPALRTTMCLGQVGILDGYWQLAGATNRLSYPDRPLEYFKPLEEWTDIVDLTFRVLEQAPPGDVLLAFSPFSRARDERHPNVEFVPYEQEYPCSSADDWPQEGYWRYDVRYHDAVVRVVREKPPSPPPDLGLRFILATAVGRPGELVEISLLAESVEELKNFWLVLGTEPGATRMAGSSFEVSFPHSGDLREERLEKAGDLLNRECVGFDDQGRPICFSGVPTWIRSYGVSEEKLALLVLAGDVHYPGTARRIGSLFVELPQDGEAAEVHLRPGKVSLRLDGRDTEVESGAYPPDQAPDRRFSPAVVEGGIIQVLGKGFERGDTNGDGRFDVSDPVAGLSYLFAEGHAPGCLDAADANDSGLVEVGDAVMCLFSLFGGLGHLPRPFVFCGRDPTADALDCLRASCAVFE